MKHVFWWGLRGDFDGDDDEDDDILYMYITAQKMWTVEFLSNLKSDCTVLVCFRFRDPMQFGQCFLVQCALEMVATSTI